VILSFQVRRLGVHLLKIVHIVGSYYTINKTLNLSIGVVIKGCITRSIWKSRAKPVSVRVYLYIASRWQSSSYFDLQNEV